jgi:hypothetical protein
MTLSSVIAAYVDLNQSMGMRFQVDTGCCGISATRAHRLAASPDLICAFPAAYPCHLDVAHEHRALRRLFSVRDHARPDAAITCRL